MLIEQQPMKLAIRMDGGQICEVRHLSTRWSALDMVFRYVDVSGDVTTLARTAITPQRRKFKASFITGTFPTNARRCYLHRRGKPGAGVVARQSTWPLTGNTGFACKTSQ